MLKNVIIVREGRVSQDPTDVDSYVKEIISSFEKGEEDSRLKTRELMMR